jgi:hypothetical protein
MNGGGNDMYGVVLKTNWDTEEPVTVNETRDEDSFEDDMPLDPSNTDDAWSKSDARKVRNLKVRSTETNRPRSAYVVRK